MFKNKTIGYYIGLAGGALGIITALIYVIYTTSVDLFAPEVFVLMLLAVLSEVLVMFVDMKFLTLVPVLFFSLALGFHICDRVYMFQEMINHIYGMNEKGAILWLVILLFVLNAISAVAAIIAAFSDRNKAVAKA